MAIEDEHATEAKPKPGTGEAGTELPRSSEELRRRIVEVCPDAKFPSEEDRRRALEAIPRLRAHQEAILARRGGRLIDVDAALREARCSRAG